MKTFRFNLKKPFSPELLTQTAIDGDEISVQYFLNGDIMGQTPFQNFCAKKTDIVDCSMCWKLYPTKIDIMLFFCVLVTGLYFFVTRYRMQLYARSVMAWSDKIIMCAGLLFPILFILVKLATVLEVHLADGTVHDIPVSAFIWYHRKHDKKKMIFALTDQVTTWAIASQIKEIHDKRQNGAEG